MCSCDNKNEIDKKLQFRIKKDYYIGKIRNEINEKVDFCVKYIIMKSIT